MPEADRTPDPDLVQRVRDIRAIVGRRQPTDGRRIALNDGTEDGVVNLWSN